MSPSIGGKVKGGTGLPTSAEGSRDGSPLWSAYQNSPESKAKIRSGRASPQRCQNERGAAAVMASASSPGASLDAASARHPAWRSAA